VDVTAGALTGDRVRLRELRESDLDDLVSWWQDPELMVAQTAAPFHPRMAEPIADQFRMWCRNDGTDAGFVIETHADGAVVGHTALFGATAHSRTGTFAIMIGPPHQNRGLGTEAIGLVLRFGFDELGLHRIQLVANGFNARGIATYRKAGFVEEGRSREAIFRSGTWHDQVHMGLLAHEWRDRSRLTPG
jgi:RimJ/RimL family protein N-acetyltransferase